MALVLLGPALSDARGKVGGVVFSRNAAGQYIRAKVSPVQPRSAFQQAIRATMTYCAQRWRNTLTAAQRAGWEAYARGTPLVDRFGHKQTRSGIAMYLRWNAEMRRQHDALMDTPPAIPGEATMVQFSLTGTTAAGVIVTACVPGFGPLDFYEFYGATAAASFARNFFNGPWAWRRSVCTAFPLPQTIIPAVECAIGQRWFIRCRPFDGTGRVGPQSTKSVDILA